jgi:hypothetical protein
MGLFRSALVSKLPSFTEIEKFFLMSRNKLRLADLFEDNSFYYKVLASFRLWGIKRAEAVGKFGFDWPPMVRET